MTAAIALTMSGAAPGGRPALPSPAGDKSKLGSIEKPNVEKAELTFYDAKPQGSGGGALGGERGKVEFQFNPKELTIAKAAKWERSNDAKAKKAGPPQFSGAEPCKMTLEMFFDATGEHDGSVVAAVEKLFQCCVPTEETLGQKKPSPPLVKFKWGTISSFPAFITSVSAKFTLFAASGTPIRATCTVSMEEMPADLGKQNPTSGALAVTRVHKTISGDSLASVAYAEYADPTLWRELAAYNGIDDPMRIPEGQVLMLPSPEALATGAS